MNKELNKYDSSLRSIPFYQTHESLLPFVGSNFEKYKILIVGESHYIGQKPNETAEFNLQYFTEHWWDGTYSKLNAKYEGWYNTRDVIEHFFNRDFGRGHMIFSNITKTFSETILDQPVEHITTESAQAFNYFAFMNFFQMPSLYAGMQYRDSLKMFGETNKNCPVWNRCVNESSAVLDRVIDILTPKAVVFCSVSAYYAFKGSHASNANDSIIEYTSHPGCPWWYRKDKNGKSGREKFEEILKKLLN